MALYDYRCSTCNSVTERSYPMGAQPLSFECEQLNAIGERCDGTAYRAIGVPVITFKGVGWAGKPAIFSDPIAAGHPQQATNWGTEDPKNYGVPLGDPYKKIVVEPPAGATEV